MEKIFIDATPEQEQAYIDERRKSTFLAACQWPLSWFRPAQRHKKAADILYEISYTAYQREMKRAFIIGARTLEGQELIDLLEIKLLDEYYLLAGYALECIFKGCLLAMQPELVINEKRLDKMVVTHDLCKLCHDCSIPLSQEESELLKIITQHIVWGKYAGPIKLEDMPISEEQKYIGCPFHERRVQLLVNGIFQRGLDLLNHSSPRTFG